ncbi:hypothetical protein [Viridibacillus arvi]|uniref:hypothetical protein n=1 Tax=Viridibacillus arvi TaxID=263475 RepID=UPI0034CFE498
MPLKIKYITGFNEQGVYLNESELTMLLFLYEHKLLTQKQLFEVFKLNEANHKYGYNSFCNRLSKFEKLGVIKRTKYELIRRNSIYMYLVEVDQKGIDILYYAGYLKNNFNQRIPKSNYEHLLGIKQSVIEAYKVLVDEYGFAIGVSSSRDNTKGTTEFLYLLNQDKSYEIAGIEEEPLKQELLHLYKAEELGTNPIRARERPENALFAYKGAVLTSYNHITNYFRDRNLPDDFVKGLYPDWMLSQHRNTFDIEFDTGTEKFDIIRMKMDNYMELNKKDTQKHTVFFVSLDDSITTRGLTEIQTSRLAALKHFLMVNDSGSSLREQELDVYLFPLARTQSVYKKVMLNDFMGEREVLREFVRQNSQRLQLAHLNTIESLNKNRIYRTNFDDYNASIFLQTNHLAEPIILMPFYIKEGDIKSMDEFCYFGGQIKRGELPNGYTKAIGIYETKEELFNDIVSSEGIEYNESIMLYCLEDQKFYDAVTKIEAEIKLPSR